MQARGGGEEGWGAYRAVFELSMVGGGIGEGSTVCQPVQKGPCQGCPLPRISPTTHLHPTSQHQRYSKNTQHPVAQGGGGGVVQLDQQYIE